MRDCKGAISAKALSRLTVREPASQNLGASDEKLCNRWMGHIRQQMHSYCGPTTTETIAHDDSRSASAELSVRCSRI